MGDEYYRFYAGGDREQTRRICLATAPVSDVTKWRRHGPLFDVGGNGAFDELWCVLPCVHRIGGKWHLYYSGRSSGPGGLQAFCGIGLAVGDDLKTWEKRHRADPEGRWISRLAEQQGHRRRRPGENLSQPPTGTGWEGKMTEYPNVIEENGKLRLFYSGNGYGSTGIGAALADPLD